MWIDFFRFQEATTSCAFSSSWGKIKILTRKSHHESLSDIRSSLNKILSYLHSRSHVALQNCCRKKCVKKRKLNADNKKSKKKTRLAWRRSQIHIEEFLISFCKATKRWKSTRAWSGEWKKAHEGEWGKSQYGCGHNN